MAKRIFKFLVLMLFALNGAYAEGLPPLSELGKPETTEKHPGFGGIDSPSGPGVWSPGLLNSGELGQKAVTHDALLAVRGRGVSLYSPMMVSSIRFLPGIPMEPLEDAGFLDSLNAASGDIELNKLDDEELGAINGRALWLPPAPGRALKISDIILWDEVKAKMICTGMMQQVEGQDVLSTITTMGTTTLQRR